MTRHTSTKIVFAAFLLNLSFSVIEFLLGLNFNSSAILADAVHDMGDAFAIGLSYYLERLSNRQQDGRYTLGYKRFSLLGAMVTATILITGSSMIVAENIFKIFRPEPVNHQGMLILGIMAIIVNLVAAYLVKDGHSHNEKILSLHFLEDILGWFAVIIVAIVLRFTDWYVLDPLLSVLISLFVLSKALPQFCKNLQIFLEKAPDDLPLEEMKVAVEQIEGVVAVNQFNVWSLDGIRHVAMIHVLVAEQVNQLVIKDKIHHLFEEYQIVESAVELDYTIFEHNHHTRFKLADHKGHGHSH